MLPAPPKQATSLSSNNSPSSTQTSKRFGKFVGDEELSVLAKGVIPANTDKSTKWALPNFNAWKEARNREHPNNPVPEDLFTISEPEIINTQLSRYVVETRKSNGDYYPPKTLHQLLCGLLRHMRSVNPGCPNFLDKKDSRFKPLQGTMDSIFINFTLQELAEK